MTTTAKNFTSGRQNHQVQVIVLHSAENQELPGQAAHLAQWFAGTTAPEASANVMVDNAHIVTSVEDTDTAWAVDDFPLNLVSWNVELTGHASNTAAQWADAYETATIKEAVLAVKSEIAKHNIPAVHLTDAQIMFIHLGNKDIKGICTHADISRALKISGGHSDPGLNFPLVNFIHSLV